MERRSIWGSKIEATSLKGKGGQNGYSRDVKHVEPGWDIRKGKLERLIGT